MRGPKAGMKAEDRIELLENFLAEGQQFLIGGKAACLFSGEAWVHGQSDTLKHGRA